jgi:hypothetical protein
MRDPSSRIHDATKFVGPHKSRMCQYIIKFLFNRAQPTWVLIDIGGGYHLQSSKLTTDLSPTFPSDILHFPLVSPLGLIKSLYQLIIFSNHSNHEQGYKKP